MKQLKVTWKGITPLLMHSCKCVNPLHPISKASSLLTSKKKKTEEDHARLADLDWLAGAYLINDYENIDDYFEKENDLYMPAENIEATIVNAGKNFKKGTKIQKYCYVLDERNVFNYGEKKTIEELINDYSYRDTRPMNVMRSKILRTRPRFNRWETVFTLMYDESQIDLDEIVEIMKYAGQYVGLCDSRPKYGKFVATIEEI